MRIFAALLLFPLVLGAQQTPSKGFIGVKGKEIVYPDGKPMLIKGTNLGNWLLPEGYMFKFEKVNSPRLIHALLVELLGPAETKAFWQQYLDNYITEADIRFLKQAGANSIRLPFDYRLFTKEDYLGDNDSTRGFRYLDRVVGWCKKYELPLLLDMHAAPGGQTGDNIDNSNGYPFLYTDVPAQQLTIHIWQNIARRYSKETIILGYDLLNEPIAHYFDATQLNPLLEPLYKKIVAAIRAVDPNHLIFLEGSQWASSFKLFGKPFDDKLVYSFHKYWTDTTQEVIQEYLDFRDKYQVPIYVGETGENDDRWVLAFRRLLEKHNIGWHYWPYKKMESTSCVVQFPKPVGYDVLIQYSQSDRSSFEAIRAARPKTLPATRKALNDFITNSKFEHCFPNPGYIHGIGMKVPEK
ncbi:MAG: glycoside hydrolase family 5 protein [Chitinophagaceae bacterium]|nr:glycoside hydrolase family 5 protein [Chitinophagaceae bacterium]